MAYLHIQVPVFYAMNNVNHESEYQGSKNTENHSDGEQGTVNLLRLLCWNWWLIVSAT